MSDDCLLFCTVGLYLFYRKSAFAQFKKRENMIGHHTHLGENDDLPRWRPSAIKKEPGASFNVHVLINVIFIYMFTIILLLHVNDDHVHSTCTYIDTYTCKVSLKYKVYYF